MPTRPSSRPCPECLTPPKGMRGSEATILLMKTMPASSSLIKRCCSSRRWSMRLRPNRSAHRWPHGSLRLDLLRGRWKPPDRKILRCTPASLWEHWLEPWVRSSFPCAQVGGLRSATWHRHRGFYEYPHRALSPRRAWRAGRIQSYRRKDRRPAGFSFSQRNCARIHPRSTQRQ